MARKSRVVNAIVDKSSINNGVYKKQKGWSRDWYPDGKKSGWNTSMIAKINRDERYAGHMVYHKKVYEAFDSKHQIDVDKSEWIVVRNMHEGIVTQEEFDMANANMQKSSRGKRGNPANKKKIFLSHAWHELKVMEGLREYTLSSYAWTMVDLKLILPMFQKKRW